METIAETSNLVKSDEVIGVAVINQQNESLGKVYEIVLDKRSGKVAYAVLESGGVFGLGGKLFALPWRSLNYDPNENSFRVNLSKDQIKNSPGFDKNNWPKSEDASFWDKTNEYYKKM